MPKHNKRVTISSDRLARRHNHIDPNRSELLKSILEEGSSISLNDGSKQQNSRQALEAHSKLLGLIDELRKVECQLTPELPVRTEKAWSNFFEWVNSGQAHENDVKLSDKVDIIEQKDSKSSNNSDQTQKEFSLIAKVPFKRGDNIFTINKKLMLSTETVTKDEDLAEFIENDSIASGMQNVVLALHLLNEYSKGEKSYWYPYLAILPDKILPVLTLNKEKIQSLLPSSHLFEALKMIRAISRQYSYFIKRLQATHLPLIKNFTYDYYCWGVSMVCSRQNDIPPSDRNTSPIPVHALIPILDMCNHDNNSNQAIFEQDEIRLFASSDLKINDEITINYGIRSSGDFYIHNGFVPNQVPFDILPLNLMLDKDNRLFEKKSNLLKTLNMPNFGKFKLTHNDYENRHKRDPHLTMFLIVYLLSEAELDFIMGSDNPVGIADEIYEYVQYDQKTPLKTTWNLIEEFDNVDQEKNNPILLKSIKERLASSVKEYLSKRASIGVALIERQIKEDHNDSMCKSMRLLLEHEKSIYESHILNKNKI